MDEIKKRGWSPVCHVNVLQERHRREAEVLTCSFHGLAIHEAQCLISWTRKFVKIVTDWVKILHGSSRLFRVYIQSTHLQVSLGSLAEPCINEGRDRREHRQMGEWSWQACFLQPVVLGQQLASHVFVEHDGAQPNNWGHFRGGGQGSESSSFPRMVLP